MGPFGGFGGADSFPFTVFSLDVFLSNFHRQAAAANSVEPR